MAAAWSTTSVVVDDVIMVVGDAEFVEDIIVDDPKDFWQQAMAALA